MAAHSSAVLPGPYTASGRPCRRARWWSIRAKPRSANGSRSRRVAASWALTRPAATSSSRCRRAIASTSLSCPLVPGDNASTPSRPSGEARVGFLGPLGTFTEQALLSQPDLANAELVPLGTIRDVLHAVVVGRVDLGFVPIENA